MGIGIATTVSLVFPSLLIIWMGSLYLRKKSIVISYKVFWGFIIMIFLGMFIVQIFGAYQDHLEFKKEWEEDFGTRFGSPPSFNVFLYVLPIIMIIPMFFIFYFLFKDAILIYNIRDEDLSKNLSRTLQELGWKYDRDFTYIHVSDPKIKIKVGMMDPMRMCQIFFKDVKDKEVINQFTKILKNEIGGNTVAPFLSIGLSFIFMGIFVFLVPFIILSLI
jgi:hypothetical protein